MSNPKPKRAKGTGQIVAKGPDRWLVRVFAGADPLTGKRKYFSETVHGKQKAAQQKLTELQARADSGKMVTPEKVTVAAYLERWLQEAGGSLARQTRDSYAQIARCYINPHLGTEELGKLKPLGIQTWVNKLSAQGLSAQTVSYAYAVLRTALLKAEKWEVIATTPCRHIELPRRTRPQHQVIAPEEVGAFMAAAQANPLGTMIVFGLSTGARPGEVAGALWTDLDLEAGTWNIQRSLVRFRINEGERGAGWELKEPKTSTGRRQVCLPPSLVAMLRRHRVAQAKARLAAGPLWQDHGLVFASQLGTPIFRQNINAVGLKPILKAAGLSEKTCRYDLRHSLATIMANNGEHPRVTAQQLGHSDPAFTMKVYTHPVPSMMKQAAARLETTIFGAAGPCPAEGRTSQA